MNDADEELACDYVLDRLDPAARAAFELRLESEISLRQRVGEYEAGLAAQIQELPARTPSHELWPRIAGAIGPAPSRSGFRWAPVFKWGIAAVIALSLASLALERWLRPERPYFVLIALDRSSSQPTRLALEAGGPDGAFAQLASCAANRWQDARAPGAFAVFDPASNQGFIAVRALPAAGAGSHYQVWILDARTGAVRPAGILPSAGLYSFAVDPLPGKSDDKVRVVVTREAGAASVRHPGPDVVLGG